MAIILDGQEITPDSLLWWSFNDSVIRVDDHLFDNEGFTHLDYINLYGDKTDRYYRWPDVRDLAHYLTGDHHG